MYLLRLANKQLYYAPETLPCLRSTALFGNARPLRLEIGCGTGEYLCALARRAPDVNFAGVELHAKSLHKAVEIADGLELENIRFIHANMLLLYPLLAPRSLEAVYLHFPDPNAEPRYHKRRVFTARFLDVMAHALVPGGLLSVMTDHSESFCRMLELADGDGRFATTHPERYLTGFEPEVKSRFQRIWEGYGLPTLRFELRRVCAPDEWAP
jgi:tRNA (guanine-N7-)-methyltransferase